MRRVATRGRGSAAAGLAAVLALTVAGCTSKSSAEDLDLQPPATSAPSMPARTATPTPTPSTEAQKILTQYDRFWATTDSAWRVSRDQRVALFKTVATEPVLTRVVGGMLAAEQLGETGYGKIVPHPRITRIDGGKASLRDCQDASLAGRIKTSTGRKTTRGTTHDLAQVTMRLGNDGVWRVATALYQPVGSC